MTMTDKTTSFTVYKIDPDTDRIVKQIHVDLSKNVHEYDYDSLSTNMTDIKCAHSVYSEQNRKKKV